MVYVCGNTKYISLDNQPCMTRPTLININPDKHNQGLRYYLFMVNLDISNASYNTLDDPSGIICAPTKKEDANLNVFNMIRSINKSKTLIKHTSCEYKCKIDGRKCNSNQKWDKDKQCGTKQ